MTKEEQQICDIIEEKFPGMYDKDGKIPNAYQGSENIKAIIIGADPTYISGDSNFKYVFGLEDKEKSPFFRSILNNLKEINLSLDDIYVQNLVRNHCVKETSKNIRWLEIASLWVELLKKELDKEFPQDIPVLVTAWIILKALIEKSVIKELSPKMIYTNARFIQPKENLLERTLIPFFRHPRYQLKSENWLEYKKNIINSM